MDNYNKYLNIFTETFAVSPTEAKNLKYQGINTWDSVGHMGLIAAIEDSFNIMFETDDIIDLSSFKEGIDILKKYGIKIDE